MNIKKGVIWQQSFSSILALLILLLVGCNSDDDGIIVTIASDTPTQKIILSDGRTDVAGSQALIDLLHLRFEGKTNTVAKIISLKLKRIGSSSDSDIDNVYLYEEGGKVKIAEMNSLSSDIVTFSNSNGLFSVSGLKTIYVLADINKDVISGQSIGFSLNLVSDIETDGITIEDSFPLEGNLMPIATISDFGRLQINPRVTATTTNLGSLEFEAFRWEFLASNQNIELESLRLFSLGSISNSDLTNLKLYADGVQIGNTVPTIDTDRTVRFDLYSSPLTIAKGLTKTMSVKVDIAGGVNQTIQFAIQKSSDVIARDTTYRVYVKPDIGIIGVFSPINSTFATIN